MILVVAAAPSGSTLSPCRPPLRFSVDRRPTRPRDAGGLGVIPRLGHSLDGANPRDTCHRAGSQKQGSRLVTLRKTQGRLRRRRRAKARRRAVRDCSARRRRFSAAFATRSESPRPPGRARPPAGKAPPAHSVALASHAAAAERLEALACELERSHPGAAASLRGRLMETLTVNRLDVSDPLKATLSSTTPTSR